MKITPCHPVGAIVEDYQLEQVTSQDSQQIMELLAEHGMLAFRKQNLTDHAFKNFLEKLGPMTFTTGEKTVDGEPSLNVVTNVGRTTKPKSSFHSDSTYFKNPPAYTALRAVELPETGGETLFTNQYGSYETLPASIKKRLESKTFTHEVTGVDLSDHPDAERMAHHPAFLKHPISGRTALFMSTPQRCTSVEGCDEKESRELVEACYAHSIQEKNIYRHQWQAGDVVIWDNGCTLHRADHSNVSGDRTLHRGLSLGYNA
jgi:taurine dioxygenase